MLAPPVALHSPAPEVLAASWVMMREILIVPGTVDRTTKRGRCLGGLPRQRVSLLFRGA